MRTIILVRAGRTHEGYAEVRRLERVPFAAPEAGWWEDQEPYEVLLESDPHYDAVLHDFRPL